MLLALQDLAGSRPAARRSARASLGTAR